MPELIHQILDVKPMTFNVVIMLCVIAALLTREVIGGIYLAAASVPVYAGSALVCIYLAKTNHLVVTSDPAVEAIMASIVGISAVFLFALIFTDLCRTITDWQVNRMVKARKLANPASDAAPGKPHR